MSSIGLISPAADAQTVIQYGVINGLVDGVKSGDACDLIAVKDLQGTHVFAVIDKPHRLNMAEQAMIAGRVVRVVWATTINGVPWPYHIDCPSWDEQSSGGTFTEYDILGQITVSNH